MPTANVSVRTIGRLSLYRRLLATLLAQDARHTFSHQLAAMAGVTAAQVRRDLMVVGYSGSTTRGYDVLELAESIGRFLDAPQGQKAALVGAGNLGRALLAFFAGRRPRLSIVAAFDADPQKVNRTFRGCPCYPVAQLPQVVASQGVEVGIIAVPAESAQEVADSLVRAGARGLVNFAPIPLRVPQGIYVEDVDIAVSLEKAAYFARKSQPGPQA
jgi:redox-sensing transcriptional repressor